MSDDNELHRLMTENAALKHQLHELLAEKALREEEGVMTEPKPVRLALALMTNAELDKYGYSQVGVVRGRRLILEYFSGDQGKWFNGAHQVTMNKEGQ